MAHKGAYLDHLASVPLFSACSKRELQKIAKASDELTIPAGKVLVEQGDTGRECFVLVSGTASVKRGTRKVATLGPGDCVGELSLLDHGPRTATVVTRLGRRSARARVAPVRRGAGRGAEHGPQSWPPSRWSVSSPRPSADEPTRVRGSAVAGSGADPGRAQLRDGFPS